jgi:uncharacterized protein YeaO (DUF488 family)
MAIRVVRLGTDRAPDEGVRLGTVRRPPRGVKKQDYARLDFFDVWFPEIAPSAKLVKWYFDQPEMTEAKWKRYVASYRREMSQPAASRTLDVLAKLSHDANFAVGCYCENAARCHRSVLRQLLVEHGADVLPDDSPLPSPH